MSARILIVDDEPRYLRLMEANLVTEGFQVIKATNGQEAVDLVASHQPDLVLLDIIMPVMDGYEVLEQLKSDEALRRIPVIVVSAIDQLEYLLSIPSEISIPLLRLDPTWGTLHDNPRFQKMIKRGK